MAAQNLWEREREREKEKNKQNTAYKHMKSRLPRMISISNIFLSDEAKGVAVVASNSPDTSEKLHPNAWKLVMFVQLRRGQGISSPIHFVASDFQLWKPSGKKLS